MEVYYQNKGLHVAFNQKIIIFAKQNINAMQNKRNNIYKKNKLRESGHYTSSQYPEADGRVTVHKPRRNYWGNLIDEDTFTEEQYNHSDYDFSDIDPEDDHDGYYGSDNYD